MTKASWKRLQKHYNYAETLSSEEDDKYTDRIEAITKRHGVDVNGSLDWDMMSVDWNDGILEYYNIDGNLIDRQEAFAGNN